VAKLPSVTSNIPRDLKLFLDRVRESLGNAVTRQQLESGEIVPKFSSDSGGANGFATDPNTGQEVAPPPAPTGVTATGGYRTIIVEWDEAFYPGHAFTQLWAAQQTDPSVTPTIDDAVNIAVVPGTVYTLQAGNDETWYFWAYHVNINTLRGPISSTDGVNASTAVDVDYLIAELSGQIAESELSQDLNSRIDLIDEPTTGLVDRVTVTENENSTQANQISQLSSTLDGNTATIQTQAESIDGLEAKYTVKVDNNGAVSGFGLASTNNVDGSPFSEFYVNAERFAVLPQGDSTGNAVAPFIVQGGVVYLDNARIADGTITRAKIGNAAVDTAKIADGTITNAKIGSAAVDNANIQNGAITNAKIANAAIDNANIQNGAITNAKIANATITSAKIESVDANKIDTNTLSAVSSDMGVLTAGKIQSDDQNFVIDLNQKTIKITV